MGCWIKDYYNISGDGVLNQKLIYTEKLPKDTKGVNWRTDNTMAKRTNIGLQKTTQNRQLTIERHKQYYKPQVP